MLHKFYNLKRTDKNCPSKAYLLNPDRLSLSSYEIQPQYVIKLNVGYKKNWSGLVAKYIRVNYDQIVLGTIYCEEVESLNEVEYSRIGTIKIPFLSKIKILNLPVQNTYNVEIRCKKLRVESMDIFVEVDSGLIRDDEYRDKLREKFKAK